MRIDIIQLFIGERKIIRLQVLRTDNWGNVFTMVCSSYGKFTTIKKHKSLLMFFISCSENRAIYKRDYIRERQLS